MSSSANWCEKRTFRSLFFYFGFVSWVMLFIALQSKYNLLFIGQLSTIHLFIMIGGLIFRSFKAHNSLYTIFFAFIAMYANPARLYFFDGIYLSAHHQTYTHYTVAYTTLIFSLFLLVINLFLIMPKGGGKVLNFRKNNSLFWTVYVLACIIVCVFRRTGNMYAGDANEMSTLNEYVIILFLICYIFSNNEKVKIYSLYLLYALYAFFAIITGGRIELVLLFFLLLTTVLQRKYSFKFLIAFFLLGVWMMNIFGNIRSNPLILLEGDIISIISPFKTTSMSVQASNEGDVYWASERLLCLMGDGELTLSDRIESAFSYIVSPLFPSSYLPETADLSSYKKDILTTGGGNMAPVNFFVMFGFIGVAFLAYFISYMLNSFSKRGSNMLRVYTILMIATLPRWFAYNPIQLVKLCLWGVICYYLVICVDYTMKKHMNKHKIKEMQLFFQK